MSKIKVPKAKQLPSGSWRCQPYRKGERVSIIKETEEEAVREAMLWLLKYDKSDEADVFIRKNLTLSEAIDLYISRRDGVLSPATIRGYEQIKRLRFQKVMDLPIGTKHDWQSLVNDETKDGLSAKSVINAWGLIRSVLKENGIPYADPRLPQIIKKDISFLQPEEIKPFLDAIHGDRFEMAYLLCLHSLRRSEMLALNVSDIYDGNIHVRGSIVMNKDGNLVYKETNKTSASRRDIPVFIKRLQELVDALPEGTERLVPHAPGNMFDHLRYLCKKNNLPELGFHSLRHSFASLCYHLEISEMGCQALGGWDDPATMRNIYTHLAESDKKKAEVKLKGFFDGEDGKQL